MLDKLHLRGLFSLLKLVVTSAIVLALFLLLLAVGHFFSGKILRKTKYYKKTVLLK